MERIEWVHRRFEAWALWVGSGGGGLPRAYNPDRVDQTADVRAGLRNTDAAFDASALETDRAIAQLPADLKRIVVAVYTWEGGIGVVAEKCRITPRTVHNRLCNADRRVRDWFDARQARNQALR